VASIRGGLIACLFGKSPKQTSAIVIRVDGMLGFLSEEFRRNFASLLSRSNGAGTRLLLLTIQGRLCALLPISILSPDGLAATANCVLTPAERPNAALLSPLMLKNRASAPMALLSSLSVLLDSAPTPANKERFGDSKFAPSFGRSGDTTTLYEHLAL